MAAVSPGPRRLVVMRHATAEAVAASDVERPLTDRGRADAEAAGAWLHQHGVVPDHAIVSPAVRTRETWAAMVRATGWTAPPDLEPALVHAGVEAALDLLRLVPDDARVVVLVGHNPTVSQVANLLQDGAGEREAALSMARGHPPAAFALFDVTVEWSRLSWGDGRLAAFRVPDD